MFSLETDCSERNVSTSRLARAAYFQFSLEDDVEARIGKFIIYLLCTKELSYASLSLHTFRRLRYRTCGGLLTVRIACFMLSNECENSR